ncbi:MAG: hypothetical protein RLZZ210_436 [Pseudomonadota bacterium]|jgi:hypothetical protein
MPKTTSNKKSKSESKKDKASGMNEYFEKRSAEFAKLEKEDLVNLALYFEHNMMIMSSELHTLEHIELEKEEMLESEDATDDELEEKFQELSNYLSEQLEMFEKINQEFDGIFEKASSPELKEFIKNFNNVDENEHKH